jgi:uncharacterized membrane protein YfbV (UPF0208 family)
MNSASRYYANRYQDSVALMKLSAQVMAMPGVELAAVVMASAGNTTPWRRLVWAGSRCGPMTSSSW